MCPWGIEARELGLPVWRLGPFLFLIGAEWVYCSGGHLCHRGWLGEGAEEEAGAWTMVLQWLWGGAQSTIFNLRNYFIRVS